MSPEKTAPGALGPEVSRRMTNPVLRSLETLMQAGVAAGLPASDLAEELFAAIEQDALYVLPAFSDEASRALSVAVATGRATGQNPYPPIVEGFLATLKEITPV